MQRRGRFLTFFGAVGVAVLLGLFGVVILFVTALQQGPGIDLSFLPGSLGVTLERLLRPELLVPVFVAVTVLALIALAVPIGRKLAG